VDPTGIQYLVFNAYDIAGIVVRDWYNGEEEEDWYVWILSPICSIVIISPDGQVALVR
jgi:hypothetical protein